MIGGYSASIVKLPVQLDGEVERSLDVRGQLHQPLCDLEHGYVDHYRCRLVNLIEARRKTRQNKIKNSLGLNLTDDPEL